MNCYDDLYTINNNYSFKENIDYLSNEIYISNGLLIKCWKQCKYDISILIPSTVSRRLENISWRRLYKNLNNLPEINPKLINWYKDHDINWCYGPKYTDDDLIRKQDELDVLSIEDEMESLVSDCESEVDSLGLHFDQSDSDSIIDYINDEAIYKPKRVKFNFIINSREIINGISIDYDFLDDSILNDDDK